MSKTPSIVTCCVTGAIPGDGGACGDCDPCIMGEPLVPEPVKHLIAEKNSLLNRIGDLETEIETLSAQEEWQPIETAPKDGTPLLFCYWSGPEQRALPIVSGVWSRLTERWCDDREGRKITPSHWMPRPAPPRSPATAAE